MPYRLIGMVHLGPLPGAPDFNDLAAVVGTAVRDAQVLQEAGFDAACVENLGDAPFYGSDVPPVTVAAMTRAVVEINSACSIPVGVNVLRNDAEAALAIAAATGSVFIRVNVLSGSMFTDQGLIEGRAAAVSRARADLAPSVEIYADVLVKHAVPPVGISFDDAARETWDRGRPDALIVSGAGTGEPTDLALVQAARKVAPGAPVLVGSGVTVESVAEVLAAADGVIVGTAIKQNGVTSAPVSPELSRALVRAAFP